MKIIAGLYKGRSLLSPPDKTLCRPTRGFVRESVFNILSAETVRGSCVLDLFSGTGALGLEALSRGAHHVVFVEQHFTSLIKKNLETLKVPKEHYTIVRQSVPIFLAKGTTGVPTPSISLVFADPPYASNWYDHGVLQLENSGMCMAHCLAILEMAKADVSHPSTILCWQRNDVRHYGKTKVEFWQRHPS